MDERLVPQGGGWITTWRGENFFGKENTCPRRAVKKQKISKKTQNGRKESY